ncbi:MAG: BamA/TamA family outer membrane protein [Muribaculaceae bacterium]|nr:BamA/TamA family outer membrane protein [Muribaculaceae bacterium]
MPRRYFPFCYISLLLLAVLFVSACSSSRHVPQGQYLLDNVKITVNDTAPDHDELTETELLSYLRQTPNHKMLWTIKFRLGVYNLSGKDTTKWWNRWIRKLGEPPVIYDSTLTLASADQLRRVLINRGHLSPEVVVDTTVNERKRKISVDYQLNPGPLHTISSLTYQWPNDTIAKLARGRSGNMILREGDPLDRSLLEQEIDLIVSRLRNNGYYGIGKECVSFTADTTAGSLDTDLTVRLDVAKSSDTTTRQLNEYIVRRVVYVTDYDPNDLLNGYEYIASDTVNYRGVEILYGKQKYLRPGVLYENCFIQPGEPYRERDVDRTYKALSRLEILKYTNIKFEPAGSIGDIGLLDAYILLTPGKSQSITLELEGTNSEGDLGLALGIGYRHMNIGKGSETFSAKVRGSYESLSGNLDGLIHDRYMEYALDLGLSYPKFKAPFLRESFKRKINATTLVNLSMSYQERPEYTRIISTAGWSYKWTDKNNRRRNILTPIDINYVYLPVSTIDFLNQIAPDNPLLRYSYEDHFIMRLGYSFYYTNKRTAAPWQRNTQTNFYTIRANIETAGNLLYAINSIFTRHHDPRHNPYKIFGIHYSQYVKGEADLGFLHIFDQRNSMAFHVGFGIGFPYGNSTILPFEKRFYGGGANGVRGWDVRTLGPGSFPGTNSVSDFINQCGDIRFDLSAEYRAKLFWVIELGVFVDAGNIWTIKSYPNQPGGLFQFNSFYKEIAAAYGLGLRLDFNYFLLRFDLGMKAHNPAKGQEPWPIIHPRWGRDSSFHFSIGYPF